jgi:quercetin dioxygenase-like cupin family protein
MSRRIVIENHNQGWPEADVSDYQITPFEWEGKEKPDWMHSMHTAGGIEMHTFEAAPSATFEGHKAPGEWIGIVVEGDGKLLLTDDEGRVRSELAFAKGDVFVFKSNTMHGWIAGPQGAKTVFMRVC